MELYIHQNGKQLGPFPIDTVKQMLATGGLTPADLVWHEGAPVWVPLRQFLPASPPATAGVRPPPLPARTNDKLSRQVAGIKGLGALTVDELLTELQRGGRFVMYQFCVSALVITFKRPSGIYFIRGGESTLKPGIGYSTISFFCGWWGIPWGPIWTISTMVTNCSGGKDVTKDVTPAVLAALTRK